MKTLFSKALSENSQIKIVYVLLDGVGDLPHPDIENKTPLQAAKTPNMDKLAKNGKMGEVISVGKYRDGFQRWGFSFTRKFFNFR